MPKLPAFLINGRRGTVRSDRVIRTEEGKPLGRLRLFDTYAEIETLEQPNATPIQCFKLPEWEWCWAPGNTEHKRAAQCGACRSYWDRYCQRHGGSTDEWRICGDFRRATVIPVFPK